MNPENPQFSIKDHMNAADLPLRATPGDEEEINAIGESLAKIEPGSDPDRTNTRFHTIMARNTPWMEKDLELGNALQEHFADHPHPLVQKLLGHHKRGLLTGHDLYNELQSIDEGN